MIDLDNNTRLVLLTLAAQQAGHVPDRFVIDVREGSAGIKVRCERCTLTYYAPVYTGSPAFDVDVDSCGADTPLNRALRTLAGVG